MISKGRFLTVALGVAMFSGAIGAQPPLGIFGGQADIGRAKPRGSAIYDPQRQEYLVAGSGENIWTDHYDFHFVWKRLTGNFILSTRAHFIGLGLDLTTHSF